MKVYIPTFYGDINIMSGGDRHAELTTTGLLSSERTVVIDVLKKFKQPTKGIELENKTFTLNAPIDDVHRFLVKKLKLNKETISAVKISNGKIEEVKNMSEAIKKAGDKSEAVTVEKPKRGCPIPITEQVNVRATDVLTRFLNQAQLHDFNQYGAFVAIGGDTCQRYRIAHRYSRVNDSPDTHYFVMNLDTGQRICSETTQLPPSEEVLALFVMISCREREWVGNS